MKEMLKKAEAISNEIKMEVLMGHAQFWAVQKIQEHLKEKFNCVMSYRSIYAYKNSEQWKPMIEKFRDQYVQTLSEVPLFHKKRRLEELQEMFERYRAKGNDKEARQVLASFREETEAKRSDLYLTNVTYNEFKQMSNEELDQEYIKLIEQKKRLQIEGDQNGMGS